MINPTPDTAAEAAWQEVDTAKQKILPAAGRAADANAEIAHQQRTARTKITEAVIAKVAAITGAHWDPAYRAWRLNQDPSFITFKATGVVMEVHAFTSYQDQPDEQLAYDTFDVTEVDAMVGIVREYAASNTSHC